MMAAYKADATLSDAPRNRTLQPIVTGTTVIGTCVCVGRCLDSLN